MIRPAAQEKQMRLLVRMAPAVPFRVIGDAHHLREVLLNLLSNAVKFTGHGYVSLDVRYAPGSDAARLRFEVHDTGIGIAPAALPTIFDAFTQEDTSTSRRYGGSGLGTTISRQLVELMEGRIGVESIKGRATMFWFELPLPSAEPPEAAPEELRGARVLVLSDLYKHLYIETGSAESPHAATGIDIAWYHASALALTVGAISSGALKDT